MEAVWGVKTDLVTLLVGGRCRAGLELAWFDRKNDKKDLEKGEKKNRKYFELLTSKHIVTPCGAYCLPNRRKTILLPP